MRGVSCGAACCGARGVAIGSGAGSGRFTGRGGGVARAAAGTGDAAGASVDADLTSSCVGACDLGTFTCVRAGCGGVLGVAFVCAPMRGCVGVRLRGGCGEDEGRDLVGVESRFFEGEFVFEGVVDL